MKAKNFIISWTWFVVGGLSFLMGLFFLNSVRPTSLLNLVLSSLLVFFIPGTLVGYFFQRTNVSKRKHIVYAACLGFLVGSLYPLVHWTFYIQIPLAELVDFFGIAPYSSSDLFVFLMPLSYILLFTFIVFLVARRKA